MVITKAPNTLLTYSTYFQNGQYYIIVDALPRIQILEFELSDGLQVPLCEKVHISMGRCSANTTCVLRAGAMSHQETISVSFWQHRLFSHACAEVVDGTFDEPWQSLSRLKYTS